MTKNEVAATATADYVSVKITTTDATADKLKSSLPKSLRLRTFRRASGVTTLELDANLWATQTTGERNEAGIKRYRSMIANLAKLGISVEHTMPWANCITADELDELTA